MPRAKILVCAAPSPCAAGLCDRLPARGIDWIRWIISVVVAAVLVMIATSLTGGRRGKAI
jgi:hypothetical protein